MPQFVIENLINSKQKQLQFNSCFISYSSDDKNFVKKLHDDLQDRGVRCWFAPKDLPTGAMMRPTINDAIRAHDKLLVIFSKYSMASRWVQFEVARALNEEIQQSRTILFPIRLDETVLLSEEDWIADIRTERNIGDFTDWDNSVKYRKAFDRLLTDLTV